MSEPLMMPIDALRPHPLHDEIFGVATAESMELIRASVLAKGFVTPILITAPDAKDNPSCVVDGHRKLQIARELGFTEVPVVVDATLQTEVAQVERMFHGAQRADFTPRERARQVAAFRDYLASLPLAERRQRYGTKQPMEIVAMVVSRSRKDAHCLDVVFTSPTSTAELKAAVDSGRLPLRKAHRIITTVERRRQPGSKNAKHLVNQLLEKALDARRVKSHGRAPRTPTYSAAPKPPSFLVDLQRQVADWALSQTPANLRNTGVHAPEFEVAVRDLMVELRAATSAFKGRVRRLIALANGESAAGSVRALNEALAVLTLKPVSLVKQVDVDEVRRTHRLLARAYHPDLNASQGARDEFERVHSAYENVLAICDR